MDVISQVRNYIQNRWSAITMFDVTHKFDENTLIQYEQLSTGASHYFFIAQMDKSGTLRNVGFKIGDIIMIFGKKIRLRPDFCSHAIDCLILGIEERCVHCGDPNRDFGLCSWCGSTVCRKCIMSRRLFACSCGTRYIITYVENG